MKRLLFTAPLILISSLLIYFILTTSPAVSYWADDFCSSVLLRNSGYVGSLVSWWNNWTGRYSYIAILSLVEIIGPLMVKVLPALLVFFLILPTFRIFKFEKLLGVLFISLVLINAPNLIQTLYWQTGSLNYIVGFIFFNLFLINLSNTNKYLALLLSVIFPILAGGFSEVYALFQLVALIFVYLIIFVSNIPQKNYKLKLIIIGIVSTIVSIGIMSLSSGNAARYSLTNHAVSLSSIIASSLYGTKWYFQRTLLIDTFTYSLVLSISVINVVVHNNVSLFQKKFANKQKIFVAILLTILMAVFSTFIVVFSGFYSMNYIPPERAMFVAVYAILFSFWIFSFLMCIYINTYFPNHLLKTIFYASILVEIVMSILIIKNTYIHWSKIRNDLWNYKAEFDVAESIMIKSYRYSKTVEIKNIKPVGDLDGFTENNGWVLGCVREYYMLNNVKLLK